MVGKLFSGINVPPTAGGARTLYTQPGARADKRIVFVNGIMNTAAEHASSCKQIIDAIGCEVLGVYNQKGTENVLVSRALRDAFVFENMAFDLGQCISDQVGLLARGAKGYIGTSPNGCTNSLLNLFIAYGHNWPTRPLCIMSHSQGNLITSNALMQYSALMSGRIPVNAVSNPALKAIIARGPIRIHVFAVASPAMTWPINNFITMHAYWHQYDPVTALSGYRNLRATLAGHGTRTSGEFGHSLDTYLDDQSLIDSVCRYMRTKPLAQKR